MFKTPDVSKSEAPRFDILEAVKAHIGPLYNVATEIHKLERNVGSFARYCMMVGIYDREPMEIWFDSIWGTGAFKTDVEAEIEIMKKEAFDEGFATANKAMASGHASIIEYSGEWKEEFIAGVESAVSSQNAPKQ